MSAATVTLLENLFDDAGLFPPACATVADAVTAHARHRVSWYDDLLATFSSNDSRLTKVNACTIRLGLKTVDVTAVVPAGLDAVPDALATMRRCPQLTLRAVDAPIRTTPTLVAARMADALAEDGVPLYVEVPAALSTEARLHELRAHGLRLTLRAGGTSVTSFTPESQLALMIVTCAAELLPFRCVTGMSHAVRHRDPETLFQRHGFLNVALATHVAVRTGSEAAVREALAERDQRAVATQVLGLTSRDVTAVRALLTRVATSDVVESVGDLTTYGLLAES